MCCFSDDQRQQVELLYRKALKVSEGCVDASDLQVADILLELGKCPPT